jgi:hypothetical protein
MAVIYKDFSGMNGRMIDASHVPAGIVLCSSAIGGQAESAFPMPEVQQETPADLS